MRPAHHIVSARQAYAHRPCVLRPGHPLPLRPSETLQRSPGVHAPPPRPRRHRVHPSARHPRPLDPGPRMPPPQRRRVPARHRTVPRPRTKSMGRKGQHRDRSDCRAATRAETQLAKTTSGPAAGYRGHAQPPAPAAPAPRAPPSRTSLCTPTILDDHNRNTCSFEVLHQTSRVSMSVCLVQNSSFLLPSAHKLKFSLIFFAPLR